MSKNIVLALVFIVIIAGGALFFAGRTAKPNDIVTQVVPTIQVIPTMQTVNELKLEDIKVGEGREVKSGDMIVIHYKGTLLDGTKFDSSYDRGTPFETRIGVGQVIKGWDEGVIGMKIGGKRKLTIPPDKAYGNRGAGPIPPNSALIFDVELINIK